MTHHSVITTQAQPVLSLYKERINEALAEFLAEMPLPLETALSPAAFDAFEKLRLYALRPGKRIRGSLAAAAYDHLSGQAFGPAGIALGVALEIIQDYLLIVDDVMDRSDLRRGEPTIHRLYAMETDKRQNEHLTNMLAINVGLVAQHLANLALLQAPEVPDRIVAAMRRMHTNVTVTGFGQIDDLLQQIERPVTDDDILRKYQLKSSYYTFINPLQSGMALAGVSDEHAYEAVARFGEAAGVAFQLHDDYLGIFGEAAEMGKENFDDIREGKYTLLVQYALTRASEAEVASLRHMLGNRHAGRVELDRVRQIFVTTGAQTFVQAATTRYAGMAKQQLAAMRFWGKSFTTQLAELVEYAVSRKA